MTYSSAHLDELEEMTDGRAPWRPVRHHFGISSFGINAWVAADKGDRIINEHDEVNGGEASEELYLVQRGRATFELDGEQVDAPAGTFVFVSPPVKRTAFAEEPGTAIVAIGGVEGHAYVVNGWELWAPYRDLYADGKYDEVIEQGRGPIEETGMPVPLYNLACCEALAGRTEDAIAHLEQALALTENVRDYAKDDSDLDSLRDEPAYKALFGAA
jgi:tetratricopeptide (TPR) repeat protein